MGLPEGKFIELNSTLKLHYHDQGEGIPVLFVHDCLNRETGHHRELSPLPIHDDSGRIEHRHVHKGSQAEDQADFPDVETDHIRTIEGDDDASPRPDGLSTELTAPRG